ncbi:MAG: O-antigen ligase family protein [Candidatus Hydrogenedentes bacterium]|nr:O-antigen ligase family protein [Candidatus Hydrogenedentota bacterium]
MEQIRKMVSKRISKNKRTVRINAAPEIQMPAEAHILQQYWPETFAPARTALFMGIASITVALMVFSAAFLGAFTALKINLAEGMGLTLPELVSPANFDVATVVWAIATVVFLGIIHPCLGIGALLLARPWLDGYTFFSDNVYFTWSIYLLCALWLIQSIKQRNRIQAPPQMLLLLALFVVFLTVTRYSYQYYNTYQHLWLWLGYITLFFLTLNTIRSRAAWGVILTIFLFGLGLQALFSILHFEYLLPHLRKAIQDPALLLRYFKTTTINPELARRFNVNRAFGSMLFPNALAAYLLLGIPFSLMAVKAWWGDVQKTLATKNIRYSHKTTSIYDRVILLAIAVVIGILCFLAVFFVAHFPQEYKYEGTIQDLPGYLHTIPLTLLAFVGACCVSFSMLLLLTRYGLDGFWYLFRFTGVCILAPLLLYTLWITYSRGAYLGLIFTAIWSGILLLISPTRAQQLAACVFNRKNIAHGLLLLFFLGALLLLLPNIGGTSSYAQEMDPRTLVHPEGITLSAGDLADPASLRLRFGYWRVALRMALDNPLTGVGLGNFAIAYPAYQYIGAGDVREAHNGFLQVFSETGLMGGLLFAAFWIYFGLWGAWRIVTEKNKKEKLLLLGLYAGVVAFCIHAFVDIDFSHPSLVMFVMVYAGLFYARAAITRNTAAAAEDTSRASRIPLVFHRITAAVLLVVLLIGGTAVFRVYAQQLALNRFGFINISNNNELSKRMRAGQFFIPEMTQYGEALRLGGKPSKHPRLLITLAQLFLNDYEKISDACVFYKPAPDQKNRFLRLPPEESVPKNGLMVVARKPFHIRDAAMDNIVSWIEELIKIDQRFPHHHELALNIIKWYEMHVDFVYGPKFEEIRPLWISEYLKWSGILAQRNPHHADVRMFHAQALLKAALLNENDESEKLIEQAVQEWETVIALTPITHGHKYAYAATLSSLGDYYKEKGDKERAKNFKEQAEVMRLKAADIQEKRREAHLYH